MADYYTLELGLGERLLCSHCGNYITNSKAYIRLDSIEEIVCETCRANSEGKIL